MPNHYTDPDATPASQDQFWHDDADWTPSAFERPMPSATFAPGATVARWWDSLLGGSAPAGRAHGDRATGSSNGGGAWSLAPRSRGAGGGGLDPKVARLGGLIVAVTVAVPLVLGFTSSPDDDTLRTAEPASTTTIAAIVIQPTPLGDQIASDGSTAEAASVAATSPAPTSASDTPPAAPAATAAPPATAAAPPVTAAPTTAASSCGSSYEIAAGDYWIRIADAADVSLSKLLEVNNATTDTALLPGRSICLPVGASTPAPPPAPTTAPPRPATTSAPQATNPPTTTTRPTTTQAPATTAPPAPSRPWSSSEVEAIIREVWPDHLEERALTIAWRESNHDPTARNYCCHGLFQIYYDVHKGWLSAYGVNSVSDLYDPWKNARAAYALYQRSGGWGPWSQTNY